jgi:hypothetical protein
MVAPLIIWGGIIGGGAIVGWAARETGDALDSASRFMLVAGGLYVSYRALKAAGAL